ncbi:MAG: LamG-like jellyroll fold domain-containing protein [Patescibacteria group bacterium]
MDLDFSTNITVPDSSSGNQTGVLVTLKDGGASASSIGFQTAGTLDYGLDIGGTIGTADIRLSSGATLTNTAGTLTIAEDLVKVGTGTPGSIDSTGSDLYVTGDLEVDGVIYGDGGGLTNITADSAAFADDADLLDGFDSTQFLRSDTSDSYTSGTLTFDPGTTLDLQGTVTNSAGDLTFSDNVQVTGDLTIQGGELFLSPISSSSSTTAGTIYYDSDNDKLYVYSDGAFHRVATDMTAYTATATALLNQDYLELVHNQATNDLLLTAWYFDTLTSQWRTIGNATHTIKHALQNEWDDAASAGFTIDTQGTLEQNLIAYWKLDETSAGTGAVARNDSYSTNHLTDNNTTASGTGKRNNGADLESGNSEFLEITDNSALSTGDIDFTLSAWVNLESKATGQFILSKRDSASVREYELVYYLAADRFEIRLHNSSGTVVCTATANTFGSPSTSTWYFLLAWHDATANTCNISINNGTADSAAETGTVSDTAANFRMGATDTTENGFFDGLIDETSFWKKLLTTQEKTDLYNSGNANTYNTATTSGSSGFIRTQSRLTNVETQPSADFGTGADGAITVSSDTNINATSLIAGRSCADGGDAVNYSVESLTATTADLESNPSTGCLAAGDEVMLINLRGTSAAFGNVGNYETLRIRSIASDVITFETAKTKYYGDNAADDTNIGLGTGNQAVMLQRVPNYTNVTVSTSGTDFTPGEWVAPTGSANNDAGEGGVMFFRATGTVSVGSGALIHSNFKGYLGNFARGGGESFCGAGGRGSSGGESGAAGAGGIDGSTETGGTGYCGGGGGSISATPGTGSASQGGAGGGGSNASSSSGYGDGGGGGYGTAGTGGAGSGAGVGSNGGTNQSGNGGTGNGGSVGGSGGGGGTYGDGSLTDLFFGSGGGASAYGSPDGGGDGGGVIFISANSISVSGSITSTGGQGLIPGSGTACAGGGAGGSIRLEGNILSLGSSLVSAAGGTNDCTGGDGGTGRIATYYVNSYSGSTSPADTSTNQPFYSYGLYHSAPIATPNSTLLESLRWEANLNTYGKISFQTRSGPSSDPTDGSWEEWRPATNGINCATPNCLLLESANTHTNWSGTAAVFEGDVTRNIDMFEDEDEPTATNVTKITTTGFETDTSGTLATSLISYWPMNETSTVAATPVTRNDVKSTNHLTDNRSATSYILSAAGKKGNAADLELSNGNFFEKTDNSELSTGDINFTVAAWVNMESESAGTTQETIISKYDSATVREYSLYYTGATTDRLRVELFDIGGTSRCTVTANNFGAVTTSTWYFVTAWHDATANTCNISINNGTANSAAETGVPADTAANLRLGANSTTEAAFFDGLIDEAGFWKKVLSSTEITDLYNSGNANTYPTSGQYAGATISSTDLSSYDYLTFWVRASQTGNTVKFGFGESAATEQEETVTIDAASTWQKVYWDLSDIAAASRNGVTKIRLTNLTSSANTIYLDNVRVESLLENQDHALITSTPNEYFQYRAIFTTTNTSFQPQLENVYLVYNDGWKLQQPDNNSVRLYNFTGQEQNVRLEAIVFGADLAEWYPTEDLTIEAGDIVSISGTNDDVGVPKIKKSSTSNDQTMLGVISTKAGLELGIPREDRRLVGLSGRVPVKIAPDSAPIVPGDLLTSSSTYPGRAQKATSAGFIVAKALEPWNPQSPTSAIMSFLNLSWADPKVLVDEDGDAAEEVSDPNQDAQTETDNESQTIESTSGEEVDSTGSDNPADENGETSEDPATQKITIPQIEAEEGFFQHLTVAVEAVFERLIAKTAEIVLAYIKDLTVDQLTVSDKTSGQEIVASGEDHLIILNSLVKENSKVFVTFRDPYAPATQYWITDIKEGESFTLTLSEPVGQEARLDYWIVN